MTSIIISNTVTLGYLLGSILVPGNNSLGGELGLGVLYGIASIALMSKVQLFRASFDLSPTVLFLCIVGLIVGSVVGLITVIVGLLYYILSVNHVSAIFFVVVLMSLSLGLSFYYLRRIFTTKIGKVQHYIVFGLFCHLFVFTIEVKGRIISEQRLLLLAVYSVVWGVLCFYLAKHRSFLSKDKLKPVEDKYILQYQI